MTAEHIARRGLVGILMLGLGFGLAPRALVPVASAQAAAAPADAAVITPIQRLDEGLLTVMKEGKDTSFAARLATLTPVLDRALNLPVILSQAVGPGWSTLTPTQQSQLLSAFRQYTAATFVENFDSYDGQTITINPRTRALSGGAQIVSTLITPANGGKKHTIDYVMRRSADGAWKATDVLADGTISRVATLRSDFSDLLSRGGASALETSLQQKTQKLENG